MKSILCGDRLGLLASFSISWLSLLVTTAAAAEFSASSLASNLEFEYANDWTVTLNPRHFYWLLHKYDSLSPLRYDLLWTQYDEATNTGTTVNAEAEIAMLDAMLRSYAAAATAASTSVQQQSSLVAKQNEFLQECRSYILSDQVIGDGLISQLDTTDFLIDFCVYKSQVCEPDYTTVFEALDFRLQLSFTRFNCPYRYDGPQDDQCLDELDAQGDVFGYVLSTPTPTKEELSVLEPRLEEYCSWLWIFGGDFHGVSLVDDGNDDDDEVGNRMPSMAPTKSSVPTLSAVPTASPTVAVEFPIDFTYIIGFDNANITARTLDDGTRDVAIMDDVRKTIRKVLAWNDISRLLSMTSRVGSIRRRDDDKILQQHRMGQRSLEEEEKWIGFRDNGLNNAEYSQIYHKRVADEDACPTSFTISKSCVRVVTEVIVYANPEFHDVSSVNRRIQTSIQNSMDGDLFLGSMERTELKEVKYMSGGIVSVDGSDNPAGNQRGVLSEGGVAGIAVGAIFLAAVVGLFLLSRARSEDDRSEHPNLQSSDDGSSYELDGDADIDAEMGLPVGNIKTREGVHRAAPLDTHADAVIPAANTTAAAAVVSNGSNASFSVDENSSHISDSEKEDGILIARLDAAVSAGNWAAVAAIAGDLSTADEASTVSSINTRKLNISSDKEGMTDADAKRAAKIEKLIQDGDWNAVGATAAAFEDGSISSGSEISKDVHSKDITTADVKKRSILDFIAGPWQSSAVSNAIIHDGLESDVDDVNVSAQSDAVSSLSGGHSPERKPRTELEAGGTKMRSIPRQQQRKGSESSISTTENARIVGEKSEKRGWKNRIPSLRRKEATKDAVAAKSLALQEDSSVSSWSHGSPESQAFVPYSNSTAQAKSRDDAPQEMQAFGEDFGLAAAEHEFLMEEEKRKESGQEDVISQKSSSSLRDELDKAIETGDWATVEAQRNKMFDAVDLDNSLDKKHVSLSSKEESDEESREGWSTASKSAASTNSEPIDDERIYMLEKLIETDDWQGIVTDSRIHGLDDSSSSMGSSTNEDLDGDSDTFYSGASNHDDKEEELDEDLSLATKPSRF